MNRFPQTFFLYIPVVNVIRNIVMNAEMVTEQFVRNVAQTLIRIMIKFILINYRYYPFSLQRRVLGFDQLNAERDIKTPGRNC